MRSCPDTLATCPIWPGPCSTWALELCPHPCPFPHFCPVFRRRMGHQARTAGGGGKSQKSKSLGSATLSLSPFRFPLWPCLACLLPGAPSAGPKAVHPLHATLSIFSSLPSQGLALHLLTQTSA